MIWKAAGSSAEALRFLIPTQSRNSRFRAANTTLRLRNAARQRGDIAKSGTKDFHGALWEFFRNDVLNANGFFRNETSQPRPVLKQNQFGFDLGGPIRKEKLLFFTSYQGTRQRSGVDGNCSSQINVPPITDDRSAEALGALRRPTRRGSNTDWKHSGGTRQSAGPYWSRHRGRRLKYQSRGAGAAANEVVERRVRHPHAPDHGSVQAL